VTERVLVLPRSAVPGGCDFAGIRRARPADLDALRDAVAREGRYIDRAVAEADAAYKQLIPYVVVRDGARVFLMHRTDAGGDARLHGRASIGVGGHLNPVDAGEDQLMAGLRREWAEELRADWEPEFTLVGLLNDESDAVGSVHLGVLFAVDAAGREVDVRESHKLVGAFAEPTAVGAAWERLETWSRHAASALGIGAPSAGSPA
jgi:predicted NUDIX family phosphoesterase